MHLRTKSMQHGLLAACILLVVSFVAPISAGAIACSFKNPLLAKGQDPSAVYHDGFYYLIQSDAGGLQLKKSTTLTDLGSAPNVTIFAPPPGQPYSYDMWAPELVYVDTGWYVYFAADDSPGNNQAHRLYALQADAADPTGKWTFKGKVYHDAPTDKWAIDGTVFPYNGQLYMVWSGWPGDRGDFPQNLYIAAMSDPLTVGVRHQIATPDQSWETSVQPIEEGPEAFIHNGQLSIVYSADASWTAAYKLGLLKLTGPDPLDAASWTKIGPIFEQLQGAVYGPGHNSMPVPSPDGSQDWLVYHAKTKASDGWEDREIKIQPFTWNADNTPNFGTPIPDNVAVPAPAGQPCGLASRWTFDTPSQLADSEGNAGTVNGSPTWTSGPIGNALSFNGSTDYLDLNRHVVSTLGSFTVAAWVQLTRVDQTVTMISQEGGIASEFALQYNTKAQNKFALTMLNFKGDIDVQATSTFSPEAGMWYHVVGARDALKGQIRIYVNGRLESSQSYNADWDARGHTIIGAARLQSKRTQFFAGKLDDVRLYNGALSDDEVAALYREAAQFF
jgi:GH43 family beta-xylosidase